MMEFRRRGPLVWVLVGLAALGMTTAMRDWPKERAVHFVLGPRAASVVELDARWSEEATGEVVRDGSFRFARGQAPRVVTQSPSLADGRYVLATTIVTVDESGARLETEVTEHVTLEGSVVTLDLAPRIARADVDAATATSSAPGRSR